MLENEHQCDFRSAAGVLESELMEGRKSGELGKKQETEAH